MKLIIKSPPPVFNKAKEVVKKYGFYPMFIKENRGTFVIELEEKNNDLIWSLLDSGATIRQDQSLQKFV